MEPPTKRQKTGRSQNDTDEDDELSLGPDELNQRRDPAYRLQQLRDKAANKLKSSFESIFAKYERDFEGVADEIDLRTGEVVVDNGHLKSLRGCEFGGGRKKHEDEHPSDQASQVTEKPSSPEVEVEAIPKDPWQIPGQTWQPTGMGMGMRGPPQLSSMLGSQPFISLPSFSPSITEPRMSLDPTWQTPELPQSAFLRSSDQSPATRTVVRSMFRPDSPDADDEDILSGASRDAVKGKESPLIRQKFPAVDSSPNSDPSHSSLINEVIGNILDTPPSIRKMRTARSLGKPSPLGQEHANRPKSKLTKNRKKAGQSTGPPEATTAETADILNGEAKAEMHRGEKLKRSDQPRWDDSDLESFRDVTGMSIIKPAGQRLFVDIEVTSLRIQSDVEGHEAAQNETAIEEATVQPATQDGRPVDEYAVPNAQEQIVPGQNGPRQSAKSGEAIAEEKFERNFVDPAFIFSDEETLPPRRVKKARRQSEPAPPAEKPQEEIPSRPQPAKEVFTRNEADPGFEFSDEENLPPRRDKRKQLGPESKTVASVKTPIAKAPTVKPARLAAAKQSPTASDIIGIEAQREPLQRRRSMRRSSQPALVCELETRDEAPVPASEESHTHDDADQQGSLEMGNEDSQTLSTQATEEEMTVDVPAKEQKEEPRGPAENLRVAKRLTRTPRNNTTNIEPLDQEDNAQPAGQDPVRIEQDAHPQPPRVRPPQNTIGPEKGANRRAPSPRRHSSSQRHPSPELGDPPFPAAAAADTRPSAAATQASTPPRRSNHAAENNKTPPAMISLISLLSEDEDDEDEISFDLSDFTPSGHHRILVHRPFPPPSSATTTAKKKKKRASLLFGARPSSTSKSDRFRTPSKGGGGGTPGRKSKSLARSVVRVRGKGQADGFGSSPALNPVVQTPGGTRRRCGEDGWRCERDFCFVCT